MLAVLAFANLVLARTLYLVGTGYMLRQQELHQRYTRDYGLAGGFERFKRISTWLMVYDTAAFILLNFATIDTLHFPVARWVPIVFGAGLGIFALSVKAWATRILGPQAYYWYNFFEPAEPVQWIPRGPYKYLNNPMYGVGYLQTYGLGFMCASAWGMAGALFMHLTIFVFNETIEKPHFVRLANSTKGKSGAGN